MSDIKVTQEMIDDLVECSKVEVQKLGEKTCAVTMTLPCGFEITEVSACVDPANYDEELGKKYALKKIEDKLWMLEGYRLQVSL